MENKNGQGIFYGVIGVATLIVAIIGATFAYFSATASNTGGIAGNIAEGNAMLLTVTRLAPDPEGSYAAGKLVPLDVTPAQGGTSQLSSALGATDECVDSNNNVVCHVYQIDVENASTAALTVSGTLNLSSSAQNLKWKLLSGAAADNAGATINSTGTSYIAGDANTGVTLGAKSGSTNGKNTYYILVWVEETGSPQDDADGGMNFTGTVSFNAVNANGTSAGGLTATFSS